MRFFASILIAFALLLPCGEVAAQGPLLIREVVSREVGIHVGAYSEPDIKEMVSREVSLFIGQEPDPPYRQVVSREMSLVMADAAAPPQVTQFTVTASPSGSTVSLDWGSYNQWQVRDVAYYEIYYSPSGPFSDVSSMTPMRIVPGETQTTIFNGLAEWQEHYFAVVAVDGLGNRNTAVQYRAAYVLTREVVSREVGLFIGAEPEPPYKQAVSREVSLVMADATPPPLVTQVNMTVSPAGDAVTLNWSSYNQWAVRDVAHYAVYYSASGPFTDVSGMTPLRIVPGESLTTTFTGLTRWQDHFFAVVAVDGLGNAQTVVPYHGAYVLMPEVVSREVGLFIGAEPEPPQRQVVSREVSVVVASADVPAPVTVQGGGFEAISSRTAFGGADLDWTHYNEWAQRDVVRYRIYVSTSFFDNVTGMTPYAISTDGHLTATITGFNNEEIIYVAVVAEDALGQFNPAVYAHSTKTSVNVLGDVSNLAGTPSSTTIGYTWDLGGVGTDLGYFVSEFRVYFNHAPLPLILSAGERTWLADSLMPDTSYHVRVTTVDIYGLESAGAVLTVRTQPAPTGVLDTAFTATSSGQVGNIIMQPDGRAIIGGGFATINGQARSRVARLHSDGSLDTTFAGGTTAGFVQTNALLWDGKMIIGGTLTSVAGVTRNGIARLHSNGALDSAFNPNANSTVFCVLPYEDGRMLVGGNFTTIGATSRSRLARLEADGTVDASFTADATGTVVSVTFEPDGNILACGAFSQIGGLPRSRIARLNPNGMVMPGFEPSFDGFVSWAICLPEGRILVGGSFTLVNGQPRGRIAVLKSDGTLDEAFSSGGVDGIVRTAVLQANGGLVAGGNFTFANGISRTRMARFRSNGVLDDYFNPSFNDEVLSLTADMEGRIWSGGSFTEVSGQPKQRIARLLNDNGAVSVQVEQHNRLFMSRSGSLPHPMEVSFAIEEDAGGIWSHLGKGRPVAGGWELQTPASLPLAGRLRARVRNAVGLYNASSGLEEHFLDYDSSGSLAAWRQFYFGSDVDAGVGADSNDFDGDSIPNLMEYAFRLNPVKTDATGMPSWAFENGRGIVRFDPPLGATGVQFGAEWTTTLQAEDWHAIPNSGTAGSFCFETPVTSLGRLFVRLRVSR